MLLQLQAEQISKYWDLIKLALQNGLPPITLQKPETINRIFESLLVGDMQCWAYAKEIENEEAKEPRYIIEGIIITHVAFDKFTNTRSLLVYLIYSFTNQSSNLTWIDATRWLQKYARNKKCDNIIAYTKNEKICNFVTRFGGDADWRFLTLPVGEESDA